MAQPPSSCLGMTDLFGSLVINPILSHGYGSTNNIKSPFYTSLYIDLYRLKMTWVNCHHFINISVAYSVGFPDVSGVFFPSKHVHRRHFGMRALGRALQSHSAAPRISSSSINWEFR